MRWLLDTNVWIDAFAGRGDAKNVFFQARSITGTWLGFSSVTRLEVLGYSSLTAADDKSLRELFAQFEEIPVLPTIIEEAIRIRRFYKLKSPDAIIAATAIFQNAEIVTRNTIDFKKITELKVLDTATFQATFR